MTDPTVDARFDAGRAVADSVLFEGYLLYPYRASAGKNQTRVRWQFGVLTPRESGSDEPWYSHTECLVEAGDRPVLDLRLRFLQVVTRAGEGTDPWDEGEVREVDASVDLAELDGHREIGFDIPAVDRADEQTHRHGHGLSGVLRVAAEPVAGPYGLLKLAVTVENHTPWHEGGAGREVLLRHSLISAHSLLSVREAAFLSLLESPEFARPAAEGCRNAHTWPVLVGEQGRRDLMLSSPIILYDYPEIAPESAGDLFDATEIDEILTLRTMALTDEEKREARATDDRAAAIIDHADDLPDEMLDRLHGAVRYLRGVTGEDRDRREQAPPDEPPVFHTPADPTDHGRADETVARPDAPWWDPGADTSVCPQTDSVAVLGGSAARGSQVRLRPTPGGADAHDMFLTDKLATVEAVLFDVDGSSHVAVTVDDDPAAELHRAVGRFFYFAPHEVELVRTS